MKYKIKRINQDIFYKYYIRFDLNIILIFKKIKNFYLKFIVFININYK